MRCGGFMKRFLLILLLVTAAFAINGMEGQGHPEYDLTNSKARQLLLASGKRKYSEAFGKEKLSSCKRVNESKDPISPQDNIEVDSEFWSPELDDYLTKIDHELEIKKLLISSDGVVDQAFFTPENDIKSLLISLIELEKKSICVAIYALTDNDINNALIAAYSRGIKIKIIVDSYSQKWPKKLYYLAKKGIKIWTYQGGGLSKMHHKFCIFKDNINNKRLILNGSFNFTYAANSDNYENITIRDNEVLVARFKKQFKLLLHKPNFIPLR